MTYNENEITKFKDEIIDQIKKVEDNIKVQSSYRKDSKLLKLVFIILFLLSIVAVIINSFGVLPSSFKKDKDAPMISKFVGQSNKYIGEILIEGPIGFNIVGYVISKLKKYEKAPDCRGVIIRMNSPGGTVGASQEIYDQILKFRKAQKLIYASVGDMAASGGYYIISACDKIIANRGSTIGSIGVIMANFNFSKIMKHYNIEYTVVKSGKYKDMFSGLKETKQEELDLLQQQVDRVYQQFINDILANRSTKIDKNKMSEYAQGQTYVGEDALKIGLIDELGSFEDCLEKMNEELNIGQLEVVRDRRTIFDSIRDMFKSESKINSQINIINLFQEYYLKEIFTSPILLMYPGVLAK